MTTHGELIYDLCFSVLENASVAELAFRSIIRQLISTHAFNKYELYERSWVLSITCHRLIEMCQQRTFHIPVEEQIRLDKDEELHTRLDHFSIYFKRLIPEDQLLFLLKEKHRVPLPEISMALNIPEGSLKTKRTQALRTLEEWLWNPA